MSEFGINFQLRYPKFCAENTQNGSVSLGEVKTIFQACTDQDEQLLVVPLSFKEDRTSSETLFLMNWTDRIDVHPQAPQRLADSNLHLRISLVIALSQTINNYAELTKYYGVTCQRDFSFYVS